MAILAIASVLLFAQFDASDIEKRISMVLPRADEEKYLQIPWRYDLAAARVESQVSGKPMFLWIMNGHPMGCT